MAIVKGIDVSEWEPVIHWPRVRAQGLHFAIIRATSGLYIDRKFDEFWVNSRASGFIRGAYHYLILEQDVRQQVDLYLQTVKFLPGDLPPILDLEEKYNENGTNATWIEKSRIWLEEVEQRTGRRPLVYSRFYFLKEHVTLNGQPPAWANKYQLWIAQYYKNYVDGDMPSLDPPVWKPWIFWQYSEEALVDGITGPDGQPTEVDLDLFRGSLNELYAFAGAQKPQPKPYTVKAGDTLASIAAEHKLDVRELLEANPNLIQAGTKLTIPVHIDLPPDPVQPVTVTTNTEGNTQKRFLKHVVKPTDTLSAIALKYGVSMDAIAEVNGIVNRNIIIDGTTLLIPIG